MLAHVGAFLLRWAISAVVLMLSVSWVAPRNSSNTFGRAAMVSLALALAWYLTLAHFLWFLILPWLLYAAIWVATVMLAYGLRFTQSLLLALALTFLSWVASLLFGLELVKR